MEDVMAYCELCGTSYIVDDKGNCSNCRGKGMPPETVKEVKPKVKVEGRGK